MDQFAGLRSTAILYCYALYLIGLRDVGIDRTMMRQAIAEFYFVTSLTSRYSKSPESTFESDLSLLKGKKSGEEFLSTLRDISDTTLTKDFWEITLPGLLAKSAARSPSLFAYQAALVKLNATALFSKVKISELMDPAINGS